MSRVHRLLRTAAIGACAAALAGCSLLVNTGLDDHPCGDAGTCLSGYTCNTSNICVKASSLACSPACPPTEVCIEKQCVNKCATQECAPASTCQEGDCQTVTASDVLGSPCMQNGDCGGTGLTCLLPYGGQTPGVCTQTCDPTSNVCSSSGQVCRSFASDSPSGTVSLCADPSLTACVRDADCTSPGFVCGVAHTTTPLNGTESATVCIPAPPATANPSAPGTGCSQGSGPPCSNGLCIVGNVSLHSDYCTEPCQTTSDCTGFVTNGQLSCVYVTVTDGTPTDGNSTRAQLCIQKATSFGDLCTDGSNCTADAPNCVPSLSNPSQSICAPFCGDEEPTVQQCLPTPQVSSGGLSCNLATSQCH